MKVKLRKIVRKVNSALWLAVTIVLLLTLADVTIDKLNHRVPDVLGYSIFRVSTGSMEPAIPTGMYVLVQKKEAHKIQTGDIITYYSEDPTILNQPNTHRVVRKWREVSGNIIFETRGDANYINDKLLVPEQRVIGKVLLNLTELTDFVEFFMTKTMLVMLLSMQFLCVVMAIYFNKLKQAQKAEAEKERQELMDQLTRQEVERLIREAEEKKKAEGDAPAQPEEAKPENEKSEAEPDSDREEEA